MQIIDGLKPKSSTGIDNISNKLLKSTKTFIVAPLTIIINQMFQVGKFPDCLKFRKFYQSTRKMMTHYFLTIDQFRFYHQFQNFLNGPS